MVFRCLACGGTVRWAVSGSPPAATAGSFALGVAPTLQSGLKLPSASTLRGWVSLCFLSLQTEASTDEASEAGRRFEGAAL